MKRKSHKARLKVHGADEDDVYEDIVRIPEKDRGELKTGAIHRFSTAKGAAYFILRGSKPDNAGKILMDKASRDKLSLNPSEECDFDIREAGFWGEFCWVWRATNPVYKVAGRLGVLSFFLGIVAVIFGFIALIPIFKSLICS